MRFKSRTKIVSIDKIARDKDLGSVLIRLMMVLNDCVIADETASMWRERTGEKIKIKQQEALKYFVELQIGHLHEGLGIVREIAKKPHLTDQVGRCETVTQEEFERLRHFEPSRALGKKMMDIRNKLTSHYDPKLIWDALAGHVRQFPGTGALISVGTASAEWLFEPGAVVNERVAIDLFDIPQGADVNAEANKLMEELQSIMEDFMRFGASFVWTHTSS